MKARNSGFTLHELLLALALAGTLVGVAAPSFAEWGRTTRVVATQHDFVTALTYARTAAVRYGRRVTVCSTRDFVSCDDSAESFASGWIAFTDDPGSRQGQVDQSERILQVWRGPGADHVTFARADADMQWITFTSNGLVSPGASTRTWSFQPAGCSTGAAQRREVSVTPFGAIRSGRLACT